MSEVVLIRHGKTVANEKHLYCGSADIPLSGEGREELAERRDLYERFSPYRMITSGLLRTDETLEILFGKCEHERDSGFAEMNFGDFEMKSYEELKTDPRYIEWISSDGGMKLRTPGGESGEDMLRRAIPAFERVRKDGRDTVIVTHGGVIAGIMAYLFPGEGKNRYEWQPECGGGYLICGNSYEKII